MYEKVISSCRYARTAIKHVLEQGVRLKHRRGVAPQNIVCSHRNMRSLQSNCALKLGEQI